MRKRWWGGGGSGALGRGLSLAWLAAIAVLALCAGLQELWSVAATVHLPGFGPGDHLAEELVQAVLWLGHRGLRKLGFQEIDLGGGCTPE